MGTMDDLQSAYSRLLSAYGPQGWWPAESPFEMAVGAILTQNTAWTHVERAIENLRDAGVLEPAAMYALNAEELAELIRPAGYYRLKAGRLRNLVQVIVDEFGGDFSAMLELSTGSLRETLLGIKGIGPETADSIVLYAAQKPVFVVDNYTARVAKRHGWVDFEADYYQLQETFQFSLEEDVQLFNEYHALIVRVAKSHCKSQPLCDGCPLQPLLPPSGPLVE